MMLFFHRGVEGQVPVGLCDTFSRLHKFVYITTAFEEVDNLTGFSGLEVRCSIAGTLVCEEQWTLSAQHSQYTMWFDLARIKNARDFQRLPLLAEALLDGKVVLTKEAELVMDLSYAPTSR